MIALVILVVFAAGTVWAKISLTRRRGAVMTTIDGMRRTPNDFGGLNALEINQSWEFLRTVREVYYGKPRKIKTDDDRARVAWLDGTIADLKARHAALGRGSDDL